MEKHFIDDDPKYYELLQTVSDRESKSECGQDDGGVTGLALPPATGL